MLAIIFFFLFCRIIIFFISVVYNICQHTVIFCHHPMKASCKHLEERADIAAAELLHVKEQLAKALEDADIAIEEGGKASTRLQYAVEQLREELSVAQVG